MSLEELDFLLGGSKSLWELDCFIEVALASVNIEDLVNKLCSEFVNTYVLSIAEVNLVLRTAEDIEPGTHSLFGKLLNYTRKFNQLPNQSAIPQVRDMLESCGFNTLEVALLMNLCPQIAEEARAMIPSLLRMTSDEELTHTLEELVRMKNLCHT
jgi:DNA-directed RNA polymerase II subunit RPB4